MHDITRVVGAQHAELDRLISACVDADWQRPTPCDGWDVADVLLHLAQTDELAIASAAGDLDRMRDGWFGSGTANTTTVDAAAAAQVAVDRAAGGSAIATRWRAASSALIATLRTGDPHARVPWVSGTLSLRTLATTRLAECWIHAGDIAAALGVGVTSGEQLRWIARLAWRTLPYAFQRAGRDLIGPVALHLTGPSGEAWEFIPDGAPVTTISGPALDWCEVAARRVDPNTTALVAAGPDGEHVLELVRTYAL